MLLYLQCFVPTASHDTAIVWGFYPVNCLDGTVVLSRNTVKGVRRLSSYLRITVELHQDLCNLHRLVAVKIPHLGRFVAGGSENFASVLVKETPISL